MRALQCERRLPVMVKQRWFPLRTVMTSAALGDSGLCKLRSVSIRVARFAPRTGIFEICAAEAGVWIERSMASRAFRRFVCAPQRKCSVRMIEMRQIIPRLGRMANPTPCLSIQPRGTNECVESPAMRICVTIRAINVDPVILRSWFRLEVRQCLVTVAARNCQMAST